MNFGEALNALKSGARVTRDGWNGHGMWLIYVPGSVITVSGDRPLGKAMPERVGHEVAYRPHIDMKTAQGDLVPWVASQSDLLAEDWRTV